MNEKQKSVKMLDDSHKAYMEFVNTARLVNQSHHITQELVYLFNMGTALLHKRLVRKSFNNSAGGVGLSQTDNKTIQQDQKEAETLFLLEEYFGNIQEETFKIPLNNFIALIIKHFSVKDRTAINVRKILVMSNFRLKEVKIDRERYIVHQTWSKEGEDDYKRFNKLKNDLEKIQQDIKFQESEGIGDWAINSLRKKEKQIKQELEALK